MSTPTLNINQLRGNGEKDGRIRDGRRRRGIKAGLTFPEVQNKMFVNLDGFYSAYVSHHRVFPNTGVCSFKVIINVLIVLVL